MKTCGGRAGGAAEGRESAATLLSSAAVRQIWAPWRMEYVGDSTPREGCVLCAIDAGGTDQEKHVVERAELTFTVLNLYPYSSGHLLVVPHRHAPDLTALTTSEGTAMFVGVRRAVRALQAALGPDGFNLGVNQGRIAGAGIADHVHTLERRHQLHARPRRRQGPPRAPRPDRRAAPRRLRGAGPRPGGRLAPTGLLLHSAGRTRTAPAGASE